MAREARETRLALFREGFGPMCDYATGFSEKYPLLGEQGQHVFRLGMDTLIRCTSRYNPEQGKFIHYLRASLRREFKKLERWVTRFSDLARYNEDGELVEFDPPAQFQSGADATLAGLEGPQYTKDEREVVQAVYQKLDEIDPELALVLRLSIEEELDLREIGQRMKVSTTTAWRRKKEAQKIAKGILKGMGLYDRPLRQRDWGETMVDQSLIRHHEEGEEIRQGWTRHLCVDPTSYRYRGE